MIARYRPDKPSPDTSRQPARIDFLGPPPLIHGEDEADYNALLASISGDICPRGILEEIFVRDIVDLTWEIARLRRLKSSLLKARAHDGVEQILASSRGSYQANQMMQDWASPQRAPKKKVDNYLKRIGATKDAIMAQTLAVNLDTIQRIDQMAASMEMRRSSIVREILRHREALRQAPRPAVNEIEAGEFKGIKRITGRATG